MITRWLEGGLFFGPDGDLDNDEDCYSKDL